MASKKAKKGKYADELAKLKELNAIKEVLKKSDIENAALTNTSKDSETVSDNAVDNMLEQLNLDKNSNRDLEIVENLASQKKNAVAATKSIPKIKHAAKKSKPKRMAKPAKKKGGKGKKR
jgi:hypothetical protein